MVPSAAEPRLDLARGDAITRIHQSCAQASGSFSIELGSAGRYAPRAGEDVPSGRLPNRLAAEIETPTDLIGGVVERAVLRRFVEQDHAASGDFEPYDPIVVDHGPRDVIPAGNTFPGQWMEAVAA